MNDYTAKLIFLDTETTGKDEEDRLFQIAYDFRGESVSELFRPPIPISIEAMETTHYTNNDVADKPAFYDSNLKSKLQKILKNNVLVAHNAIFDIEMLKKEEVYVGEFIDTMKIARYLDVNAKLGAYRLQYLRYALELNVEARPHDALGDVKVLKALFDRLFKKMNEEFKENDITISKMIEISKKPVLIRRFTFGKYNGELVSNIATRDPGYLQWLLSEKIKEKESGNYRDSVEDWIYSIEYYLSI